MRPPLVRRYRGRGLSKTAGTFFKKEGHAAFFGEMSHEGFFQPSLASFGSSHIQRKCGSCESKEEKIHRAEIKKEEEIQKKEAAKSASSVNGVNNYIGSLNGKGNPLPAHTNYFFSSRMGFDFSNVKILKDKEAADSAKHLNARAYTIGNYIVFNEGQYKPESEEGRKLIAHELAHVIQQQRCGGSSKLSRMKIGGGQPPQLCGSTLLKVPDEETGTISEAVKIVGEVANNPEKYPDCHAFFSDNCPGGNRDSLKSTFNKVTVWKKPPAKDEQAGASVCGEDLTVMAYSFLGYKEGAKTLADYFMHELMHNCGIMGESKHRLADKARLYCMGAGNKSITISLGKADEKYLLAFSFRRFLTEWRSGKLRPFAGLSTNFLLDFQKGEESLMHITPVIGIQNRFNLWGGERFGGLVLGGSIGVGYGRFTEMPQADARKFGWDAGLTLQLHAGVEFAVPKIGVEGRVKPASLGIDFSEIRPLTSEAKKIYAVSIGLTVPF